MHDLAWAAGLMEGEGSFTCYPLKRRNNSYRVSVSMSMTDKDVLDTFCSVIGVGKVKGPYKGSKKPRYTWEVQNFEECLKVSEMLLPYLHSRRQEAAEKLINLCKERLK